MRSCPSASFVSRTCDKIQIKF